MSCNHPRHAFRTGSLTENGKDEYLVTGGDVDKLSYERACQMAGHLLTDAHLEEVNHRLFLVDPLEIPCGCCVGCRMSHAKEWSVRCALEREYYDQDECFFLTLTYDARHLPKDGQLCKTDLQKFWKRLRRAGYRFRYFACGEYGETYQRPHYHAIVFGLKVDDLRFYRLSDRMSALYVSRSIQDIWSYGLVSLGYADTGSMAYVAGYCEKKQNDPHWNDYKVKPFVTMSRKPALGSLYLENNVETIISSNKVYGEFGSSHSAPVPRHFIRKIGQADDTWLQGRSVLMRERGEKAKVIEHCVMHCSDDDYLGFVKDELALQKLSKVKRS